MGTKLTDTQTQTTTGAKDPATLTKWPEYGGTATVAMEAGGTQTCTVQLRAWNTSIGSGQKEVLATFVLPVVGGPKNGDLFDSLPIFSTWDDWDWNITALGASATVRLSFVGVGV
jgi:hypothetical protein